MKLKSRLLPLLLISFLFSSCFNGLKSPKETKVSFRLDEATVNKIVQKASDGCNASRAADLDTTGLFIDVTLCGGTEQSKTAPLTEEVSIDFDDVPVNSRVYAKAQIYKYTDSKKTQRDVIYNGQSETIVVRDRVNVLSIKIGTAVLTVTFESNGGSEVSPQSVITGQTAKEPERPVKPVDKKQYDRENYAFAGWYTDEALTKLYNFELPVKDDLTLYAAWLPDFVFVQGATVNNYLTSGRSVRVSDLFVSDHEVTQEEYFAVTNSNPSSFTSAENLPVENVTWFEALAYCNLLSIKENLDPCYKINSSADPSEWGSLTAATPVSFSISANGYRLPTEAEWEFIATKAQRTNTAFGNVAFTSDNSEGRTHPVKFSLADELCLCDVFGNVAEWCFDVYSDSVSINAGPAGPNAVSGGVNTRVVRGGSYQSTASQCTPSERNSANPSDKSPDIGFRVVRSDINEYKIIKNTVTFQSEGGSSVAVQSVVDGESAVQPADPTRTGYNFEGWYLDGNSTAFDFATPVIQDIILKARWTPITYNIIFDYNPISGLGGSGVVTGFSMAYDSVISLPDDSTITAPTGYHFYRWSLSPTEANLDYNPSNPQLKNLTSTQDETVTLYAIWEENGLHHITYHNVSNEHDGDNVDISGLITSYKESQDITSLGTLTGTLRGYTFSGWLDENDNPVSSWNHGEKSTDLELYAQWTPITYTVRFKAKTNEATGSMDDQIMTYDTPTKLS